LLDNAEKAFAKINNALRRHLLTYGLKAIGCSAEMTLKVKVKHTKGDNPTNDAYEISSEIKTNLPDPPKAVSTAMGGLTQDGKHTLIVRSSGGDDGDPSQLKLATRDGRTVVDGEVIDDD